MHFKSIRLKTTLLYSGILLAIFIVYNAAMFVSVRSKLMADVDEDLSIKASEIANVFAAYEKIRDLSTHPMSILEQLMQRHGIVPDKRVVIDDLWRSEFKTLKLDKDYINIVLSTGRTLIQSNNMTPAMREAIHAQVGFSKDREYFGDVTLAGKHLRAINLPVLYKHNLPLTIQVITPLDSVEHVTNRLAVTGILFGALILLVTSFLGTFFVRRILVPVVTVTKAANNISHRDLSTRVSEPYTDIEMKQLVDSFNKMLERLEKSFIHINEFNSFVAHELKTPLAIVKGELELALEQAKDEEHKKALDESLEEIDRMIKIIKDLLLLAQLDYKPQILKFEDIDVRTFFDEILEHARMLAAAKDIAVSADLPRETLTVSGDKVHLRRIFLNIIVNAIKYTGPQGKIDLAVRRRKDDLLVSIADTGEGISDENLKHIFDKFFRVDKGEKTLEAGFGLGLSIALSIAKAHQGSIDVQSSPGEGTTFTVTLPLAT